MTHPAATAALTGLLVASGAGAAHAGPKIEECWIDLPSTEGAAAVTHSGAAGVAMIEVVLAGELGAFEMTVTPIDEGDAILTYRQLVYSRHIMEEGPLDITLGAAGRAVVRDGRICEEDGCFIANGDYAREDLQQLYDEYLRVYPGRQDCFTYYEG